MDRPWWNLPLAIVFVFLQGFCYAVQQSDLNYIGANLQVKATIVDNLQQNGLQHLFHIVLSNKGSATISHGGWKIYFYSFFMIESDHLPSPEGYVVPHYNIRLKHVQGGLFSMEPTSDFKDIGPNEERVLEFFSQNWAVSKTDLPPNWYVAAPGLNAVNLVSTGTGLDFVTDLDTVRQWKRYRDDAYNPFTPQDRYRRFNIKNYNSHGNRIIPTPKEIHVHEGEVDITSWKIIAASGLQIEAEYLRDKLNITSETSSERSVPATKNAIVLTVDATNIGNADAYILQANSSSETITVTGRNSSGVFYGVQSLLSLLIGGTGMKVPSVTIVDEPRFQYRGMCVDVARNFQEKAAIFKLIEAMTMYKMNRLHLRLADDEGWRLEIPGLPELTEVASKRCHDLTEDSCLIPQLGSGSNTSTHGSGYFTVADYKEIIRYAEARHIEVIPELDSPGHGRAAIKAMESRYRKYYQTNMVMAMQYRLVDPNDTSVYQSVQIFNDNAINPCIESTYNFFEKVIAEVVKMHPSLKIFHFGGDEVPNGAWMNSSKCEAIAAVDPYFKDPKHLKEYFTRRLSNITNRLGLNMAGWEDGLMNEEGRPYNRTLFDNSNVYGYAWQNVWEWGNARRAYDLANKDYRVVMSHATHLYFDHPNEPDPMERGLYWAPRFTDSHKTFRFMPDSLYENIDVRRSGISISREQVCKKNDKECPPLMHRENIVGMQGQLFSETILTEEYFDYMIFPRILSLAERSWHKASWEGTDDKVMRMSQMDEDWELFANTVGHKELQRLTKLGVHYRVAPPGSIIENGIVKTKTEFPGLRVQYSDDNCQTWRDLPHDWYYTPGKTIHLRTLSDDGTRSSRPVKFKREERIHIPYQSEVNALGKNLETTFEVVDNLVNDASNYSCRYSFKNTGTADITYGNWSVYFHNIRLVQSDDFPYPDGFPLDDCHMRIFHIGGSLYKFSPMKDFLLQPTRSVSCLVYAKYWQVARYDTMPNWYIAAEGMGPRVIKTTQGNSLSFVKPFTRQGQVQRYPEDTYGFYLPRTRFTYNDGVMKRMTVGKPVIPTPVAMTISGSKTLVVNDEWKVEGSEHFPKSSQYCSDLFNISSHSNQSSKVIRFLKSDVSVLSNKTFTKLEAYILKVQADQNVIEITASHEKGAFYAIQTLRQLITSTYKGYNILEVQIRDQPRFGYRGMHVDVGRNFKSKTEILKLLDAMALYKLSKFHFHITDDEGWRIEIPGLEELTTIGSKRCHDPFENHCILPQLGSDPNDGSSGSGYYTFEDYREILRYANERHIQLIPEIDMPGHCRAGIKAMEARYRQYLKYGNRTAAKEYLLTEVGDTSEYLTVQWFTDNAINPCMDSSYKFIGHIIKSLIDMHRDIQPLTLYHFGGDEVAHGAWEKSNTCKQFIQNNPIISSVKDLKKIFGSRVAKLTADEGLDLGAWEDGLMDTGDKPFDITVFPTLPRKVYGYAWSNIWEFGHGDRAYKLANAGYKVVLSHATHLYFGHPYEPDSEERGYYWATRFTDTKKTFGYIPDNIYANADIDRNGKPLSPEQICKGQCLRLDKPENIAGIQGQLWGETVRTDEDLNAMIFPRMLSLAERAWHKSSWEEIDAKETRNKARDEEWEVFANALGQKHLPLLDQFNITYRIPVPGARVEGNMVEVNTAFPGLVIQLSTDNMKSWSDVVGSKILTDRRGTIHLRTLSADRQRSSRVISVDTSTKELVDINITFSCVVGSCPNVTVPGGPDITVKVNLSCGSIELFTYLPNSGSFDMYQSSHVTFVSGPATQYFHFQDLHARSAFISFQNQHDKLNCTVELTSLNGSQHDLWNFPNPCTKNISEAKDKDFAHPSDTSKFLRCDLSGNVYIVACPQNELFSETCQQCSKNNKTCNIGSRVPLSSTHSSPCTVSNILAGNFFYSSADDNTKFIHCDIWGKAWLMSCPYGEVWDQAALTCRQRTTTTPTTPLSVSAPLDGTGYSCCPTCAHHTAPCTSANIAALKLHHPMKGDRHHYIQCDVTGRMHCPMPCNPAVGGGLDFFDPLTSTCVDGSLAIDNVFG